MAIVRTIQRDGKRLAKRVADDCPDADAFRKRNVKDWDLAWGGKPDGDPAFAIYALDVNESFDPVASPRHVFSGPGLVLRSVDSSGKTVHQFHNNDPAFWAWLGRNIAEGGLSPKTIRPPFDEAEIVFT